MEKVPILKMGDCLLVPIQVDMDDRLAMDLQDQLTQEVTKNGSKGVLIDISLLDVVDSFIGRMLGTISKMAQILGAKTVVVGMQPAVAITIIELGLNMHHIKTALNAEKGMALINSTEEASSN